MPNPTPWVAGVMLRGDPATVGPFYSLLLDLNFDVRTEAGWFAEVETPAGVMRLAIIPEPDGPASTSLTWYSPRFDLKVAALRARGQNVRLEENDAGRFAILTDPAGNQLALWDGGAITSP